MAAWLLILSIGGLISIYGWVKWQDYVWQRRQFKLMQEYWRSQSDEHRLRLGRDSRHG